MSDVIKSMPRTMDFRTLFTATDGRICRSTWWLAILLLQVCDLLLVYVPTGFVIKDNLGQVNNAFAGIRGYLGAIACVALYSLAYPVLAKRFQDRNKSGRLALLGIIPIAVNELGLYVDVLGPAPKSVPEKLFVMYCAAARLWFVVELGLLKGTPGPNRFGEDPATLRSDFRPLDAAKVIGGRLLAFYARSAAVVGIVFTQAAISRVVSIPIFLLELFPNFARAVDLQRDIATTLPSPLYTVVTVVAETTCVAVGFWAGTPIARLALRFWPITPFEKAQGRERSILIVSAVALAIATASVAATCVGAFNVSRMLGTPDEYSWRSSDFYSKLARSGPLEPGQELTDYGSRLGLASMFLGAIMTFSWAHRRLTRNIDVPFALFLRRFSSFADRSLITDVIKSMPAGMPLVFVASRSDQARNWDPFLWSFGGLRLWKPWRNLPIQIKTTDAEWQPTVERLLGRARCVVIDVSEESPGVAIEREMIEKVVPNQRVVALKSASSSSRLGPFLSSCNVVDYSSSFLHGALPSAFKVAFMLLILSRNPQNFYVWPVIFILPFLVMPAVSRRNRRRISAAITAALEPRLERPVPRHN